MRKIPTEIEHLLSWYASAARSLPWRQEIPDPYRVWVSEIMLQQTRIETVKPYFQRFLTVFPTVEALDSGSEETLFKLWEGLGYYSRARNLKKAARIIVEAGGFPATYEGLLALPGVGSYTAGAVAAIAFGEAVPAVDGNVLRVLSRLLGENIPKESAEKFLKPQIPAGRASHFTQAWMELGEVICLPHGEPLCRECPLADFCTARREKRIAELPAPPEKKPRRVEKRTVLLLKKADRFALRRRQGKGVLSGMWEFPSFPGTLSPDEVKDLLAGEKTVLQSLKKLPGAKHIFTHIEWHMSNYLLSVADSADGSLVWVTAGEMEKNYALPSAFSALKALCLKKEGKK